MSIILFIVILAVLVLVHEFGHFIVAKKSGIRVDEFGLGFPPRIWGKKYGETIYSINAIPFGGFVKIFGENPDEQAISGPESGTSIINKPKWIQALVLVAGVTFNIIFAWVLISLGYTVGLPTTAGYSDAVTGAKVIVTGVLPKTPAEKMGLNVGDEIVSLRVNDVPLGNVTVSTIQNFIAVSNGEPMTLEINRGNEKKIFTSKAEQGVIEQKFALGFSMDMVGILKLPVHKALYQGAITTANITYLTAEGLFGFIKKAFVGSADLSQMTGPVGLAGMVGSASKLGFVYVLSFAAVISLNLAIINLIPFPALDGGRLLFVLIEKIKGSPIKSSVANTFNFVGFALLLLLMAVVTYQDIAKLFVG